MRRWSDARLLAVVLFLGVLVVATSCAPTGPTETLEEAEAEGLPDRVVLTDEAMEGLRLTYVSVDEHQLLPTLEVAAEFVAVPDRYAEVGPLVSGRVVEVYANLGDVVERGTELVALESPDVGRVRAELISAQARYEVASQALEREQSLLEGRATSQREVQEAEGEFRRAEAELRAAEVLLSTFGVEDTDVSEVSESAWVVLTSPMTGTVVSRAANIGRSVAPSETLLEVVNLDELWLLADVYERDLHLVTRGQSVQVDVRGFPGELFEGRVDRMSGTLDERTRTAKLSVVLPNPDHKLRPGMFATARIQLANAEERRTVLAIPSVAVQQIDDRPVVFVRVEEGVFELRRIHTGERAGERVEVLFGLSPGEEVVAAGSLQLKGALLRATLGEEE